MKKALLFTALLLQSFIAFACDSYAGKWTVSNNYHWIVEQPNCNELKVTIYVANKIEEKRNYKIDGKWYCGKESSDYPHSTCLKANWVDESKKKKLILNEARYEENEGGLQVGDVNFTNQERILSNTNYVGTSWGRSWFKKSPNN